MMTCHYFRANLQPGTTDAAMLEHLRHCDVCLDFAMSVGPNHLDAKAAADEARQIFTRLGAKPMLARLEKIGLG